MTSPKKAEKYQTFWHGEIRPIILAGLILICWDFPILYLSILQSLCPLKLVEAVLILAKDVGEKYMFAKYVYWWQTFTNMELLGRRDVDEMICWWICMKLYVGIFYTLQTNISIFACINIQLYQHLDNSSPTYFTNIITVLVEAHEMSKSLNLSHPWTMGHGTTHTVWAILNGTHSMGPHTTNMWDTLKLSSWKVHIGSRDWNQQQYSWYLWNIFSNVTCSFIMKDGSTKTKNWSNPECIGNGLHAFLTWFTIITTPRRFYHTYDYYYTRYNNDSSCLIPCKNQLIMSHVTNQLSKIAQSHQNSMNKSLRKLVVV